MVVPIEITIAGWFVSAVFGKLLEGTIYLAKERKWRSAMRAELDRLKKARPLIDAVVYAAENGDINVESPPLLQWLKGLMGAVEDADSLLDELELHKLREQAAAANTAAAVAETLRRFRRRNFTCDPVRGRLTDVVRKFDEIAGGAGNFIQLIRSSDGDGGRRRSGAEYDRETGSLQTENYIFGRGKEKEEIVGWLTTSTGSSAGSSSAVSLFSVVGIGGLGKTALAQLVYNDEQVVEYFELTMWVCVSNNAFDCTAIAKKILESATGARHDVETLDAAQRNLKAMVTNKKLKSFFDLKDLHYTMHDLLHELAQVVSADECLRVAGNSPAVIPDRVRHLSIQANDLSVLQNVPHLTNLRTLFLQCDADDPNLDVTIDGMLAGLTNLRLLQLSARHLHVFPGSARRLIHLRYLSIGQTSISWLPRFICRLYHLQGLYLKANSCFNVSQGVPADICNLMNLRNLSVPSIQSLRRIGKLTSLQALIWFSVEDEAGRRITELGKMVGLRDLMITNLEKVKSAEEADEANLISKEQLSLLSLRWGMAPRDVESDEQLLDHLRPHSNLKHLEIHGYNGRRSPHWMRNQYTSRLAHIRISGCAQLENLPPFGQLPYLKVLILDNLEAVKQLGPEFYGAHGVSNAFQSLELLQLIRMSGLENWDGGVEDDQWFPCLNKLGVTGCPRLSVLPPIPVSLQELELNFLEITTLPKVWAPNQTSSHISPPPSSLSSVSIVGCSKLESLSQGLFRHPERLLCLENLSILNCAELIHSPAEGFENLVKLKRFGIQGCEKLQLLPGIPGSFLPPSLQFLNLCSPGGLDASMHHLLHGLIPSTTAAITDDFKHLWLSSRIGGELQDREWIRLAPHCAYHRCNYYTEKLSI